MTNELIPIDELLVLSKQQTQMLESLKQYRKDTEKEIAAVHEKIDKRIDEMPIDGTRLGQLNKKRVRVCVDWMGGYDAPAYNHIRKRENGTYEHFNKKVYAQAGRDFKEKFGLQGTSYDKLQSQYYEDALAYWDEWEPSTNLKLEIRQLNNQTRLELAN